MGGLAGLCDGLRCAEKGAGSCSLFRWSQQGLLRGGVGDDGGTEPWVCPAPRCDPKDTLAPAWGH